MSSYINDIEIYNYKGIESISLKDLKSINILIGDNNSGKTTILEAISFLDKPLDFREHLKIAKRGYCQSKFKVNKIQEIFNGCDLEKDICIKVTSRDSNYNLKIYAKEQYEDDEILENKQYQDINLNYDFNNMKESYSIRNYEIYKYNTLKDKNKIFNIKYVTHLDIYISDSLNKSLSLVIKNGYKDELVNLLNLFDENIIDINYEEDREVYISNNKNQSMTIDAFGDGVKKTMAMISKLIRAKNGVLLIDEIETSIDKDLLNNILNIIIESSKKYNIQVIATTHSIEILNILLENTSNLDEIALYRLEEFKGKNYVRRFSGVESYETIIKNGGDLR